MTMEILLEESDRLNDAIASVFDQALPYPGRRFNVATVACGVSFEHASGVRILIENGYHTSAIPLLRVQYESVVRAVWLLYGATDAEIEKLDGPLNEVTAKDAAKLPMAAEMLKTIEKHGPPEAVRPLLQFKTIAAGPMNSFIHSGAHPFRRHREGFPEVMLEQVVRSSNGLTTICAMVGAILTGDVEVVAKVKNIQLQFLSALPPLETATGTTSPNQNL